MEKPARRAWLYIDASAAHPSHPLMKNRNRISKETAARQFCVTPPLRLRAVCSSSALGVQLIWVPSRAPRTFRKYGHHFGLLRISSGGGSSARGSRTYFV